VPERSEGRIQTRRDTLALKAGGLGMRLETLSRKKNVVQKPNNQPETGCQGGQGSPKAVAPSEEKEEEATRGCKQRQHRDMTS
jgi:hypothetical protein